MFSLENSQKIDQKMNNWNIILKFIKKIEIEIKDFDIKLIVEGDKNKLLDFIIQMYETLTRKKLYFYKEL